MNNNIVKVWNKNIHDHKEKFKGEVIFIPAGKYIEMDYDEAVHFRGQYTPIVRFKNGLQDPISYKMIEIDKNDEQRAISFKSGRMDEEKERIFVCERCAKEFLTKNGLLKHIKKFHLEEMADKDARDELLDDEEV